MKTKSTENQKPPTRNPTQLTKEDNNNLGHARAFSSRYDLYNINKKLNIFFTMLTENSYIFLKLIYDFL